MAEDCAGISPELQFLENFTNLKESILNEEDGIQYRTSNYFISENDFDGEVTVWALDYLYSHKCPHSLAAAVARVTRDELKLADLSGCQVQENGEPHTIPAYNSNKLHQTVRLKVHEICENWKDEPIFTPEKHPMWPVSECAVKNSRRRMEDRHVVIPDLNIFFGLEGKIPQGFFAIFDGHAGSEAASYASTHLHHHIVRHPSYNADIHTAIKEGFKKTDELFSEKCKRENLKCGTTAVCAIVQPTNIYVAWLGDSQVFLYRKGESQELVKPHKPSREDEKLRIESQGGCVVFFGTWRVNGTLAISRAIGDCDYKPCVCSDPDIVTIPRDGSEDFLIMACDGLWDVSSPEDAALAVYTCLSNSPDNIEDISEKLVQLAVKRNSSDNISVIVAFLRDPKEIASEGIPQYLLDLPKTENNHNIHPESKLPEGIVTNGESPTKIPNNLWMTDLNITRFSTNTTENLSSPVADNPVNIQQEEKVTEYFLAQTDDEKKDFELVATTNVTTTSEVSQISLTTFDSSGAMSTTPDAPATIEENLVPDSRSVPNWLPVQEAVVNSNEDVIAGFDINSVASHSNLSPSAPEFIPQGLISTNESSPVRNLEILDDVNSSVDNLITLESIPDTVPVAEDVVDDESEEGEDWRYIQVNTKSENIEEKIRQPSFESEENVTSTVVCSTDVGQNLEEVIDNFLPKEECQNPSVSSLTPELEGPVLVGTVQTVTKNEDLLINENSNVETTVSPEVELVTKDVLSPEVENNLLINEDVINEPSKVDEDFISNEGIPSLVNESLFYYSANSDSSNTLLLEESFGSGSGSELVIREGKEESQLNIPFEELKLNSPVEDAHSQTNDAQLESPIKEAQLPSPIKDTPLESPTKEKPLESPVKEKPLESPIKEKPLESPIKEEPSESPIKGTSLGSPVKEIPLESPIEEGQPLFLVEETSSNPFKVTLEEIKAMEQLEKELREKVTIRESVASPNKMIDFSLLEKTVSPVAENVDISKKLVREVKMMSEEVKTISPIPVELKETQVVTEVKSADKVKEVSNKSPTKTLTKTKTSAAAPRTPLATKTQPAKTVTQKPATPAAKAIDRKPATRLTTKTLSKEVGSTKPEQKHLMSKTRPTSSTVTAKASSSEMKTTTLAKTATGEVKQAFTTTSATARASKTTTNTKTATATATTIRKTATSTKAATTATATRTTMTKTMSSTVPSSTTLKRTTTLAKTTGAAKPSATTAPSAQSTSTKDTKETTNKQLLLTKSRTKPAPAATTTTTTTTATRVASARATTRSATSTVTANAASTLKKTNGTETVAAAKTTIKKSASSVPPVSNQKAASKRPSTAPLGRTRTTSNQKSNAKATSISEPETNIKEKGTLDEKKKEQVLAAAPDGHGDEASVVVIDGDANGEERASPNPHGSGDPPSAI